MTDLKEILAGIKSEYPDLYVEPELPKPHVPKGIIRAMVLGTDPSTAEHQTLRIVFGLEQDERYLQAILSNMKTAGLSLDDVYIENVCRNYFAVETSKNNDWVAIARKYWVESLRKELDGLDASRKRPCLITAEIIVGALLNPGARQLDAEEYYRNNIFIKPSENMLGRTLIPFFRHPKYALRDWVEYAGIMKEILA